MKTLPKLFLSILSICSILLCVGVGIVLAEPQRVVVNASAEEEYLSASKSKPYQTYHFAKGDFFPGSKKDKSLDEMTFAEVASVTAGYLKEQKFYPAANKDVGDLLIIVSWGSTTLDVDWHDVMAVTSIGNSSTHQALGPEAVSYKQDQAIQSMKAGADDESSELLDMPEAPGSYHRNRNLKLIGFDKGLHGEGYTQLERERLVHELGEERYFIVLNAIDYHLLKNKREVKQLWSSRISTRNLGTNFVNALSTMNKAAAPTFGKNIDKLLTPKVDPDGEVEIGDLQILGSEE